MKIPQKPPPLTPPEWDFSNIPKDEIVAACFHEYYRETGAAGSLDKPWVLLSPKRRKRLIQKYSNLAKRGDEFVPSTASVDEVLNARRPKAFYVASSGRVRIKWANFTDSEIVESFKKWLKKERPSHTRAKGSGQRFVNYNVALEGLAVMRLLHEYKPSQLVALKEWPQINGKVFRGRTGFRERTKAKILFKKLFPKPSWWGHEPRTCQTAAKHTRQQKLVV